jgi:uncharacterized protein (TIGR00251 family)
MYIKVRVVPEAKQEGVKKIKEDTFQVAVKEPAENNRANKRLLFMLAEHFGLSVGALRIVSGHQSPSKILTVTFPGGE